MSWSIGFLSALTKKSISPTYRLKIRSLQPGYGDFNITSTSSNIAIGREGPTINAQRVIPGSYNITFGGFTVPIVGQVNSNSALDIFPRISKGVFAELFCTLNGVEERISCGQLRGIKKTYNKYVFEFVDIIAALGSRYELQQSAVTGLTTPDPFALFYNAGIEISLTSDWTFTTTFPNRLYVNDLRPFTLEAGEFGVVICRPSGGNDFILKFDAKTITSGNQGFLNLSHVYSTSSTIYPTIYSPVNLTVSDKVYTAQYVKGWPGDIFAKLILSEAGTPYDPLRTYPPSMNSGISLDDSFYDKQDSHYYKNHLRGRGPTFANYEIGYVISNPLNNGLRDLITVFARAGHWPVWRQNSITYRAVQNPESFSDFMEINDSDIYDLKQHEIFDTNQQNVYLRSELIYQNKAGVETKHSMPVSVIGKSLPIKSITTRDVSGLYSYDPWTASANRLNLAQGDVDRLLIWDGYLWEKLQITCKVFYAKLCPGDIVKLSSNVIAPFTFKKNQTYSKTAFMVSGVDYSINQGIAVLTLLRPLK